MRITLSTVAVWNGPALLITQLPNSVWTDATHIITHHNAHCWTSVDRPLVRLVTGLSL